MFSCEFVRDLKSAENFLIVADFLSALLQRIEDLEGIADRDAEELADLQSRLEDLEDPFPDDDEEEDFSDADTAALWARLQEAVDEDWENYSED